MIQWEIYERMSMVVDICLSKESMNNYQLSCCWYSFCIFCLNFWALSQSINSNVSLETTTARQWAWTRETLWEKRVWGKFLLMFVLKKCLKLSSSKVWLEALGTSNLPLKNSIVPHSQFTHQKINSSKLKIWMTFIIAWLQTLIL